MSNNAIADVLARCDRELWLVTAQAGKRRGGLIATFVSNASLVPDLPRMLLGLARQHHTWELIEEAGAFGLHLISEDHLEWVWRFGLISGRDRDKLVGLNIETRSTGSPLLKDALAWLDCRVELRMDTGDRTIYLAEVVEGANTRPGRILTVERMLDLAPADKRAALKNAVVHDAKIDAAAIRAWRASRQA
jgi:flavin reductase (DIM6/NTAB) family NADH-FMN oxidoreductase RutF